VTEALSLLGAKRISVASPYETWANEKLRVFMEKSGFEVLAIKGLGTQAHATVPLEEVEALVMSVDRSATEAIFVSCTDFRTLEIIETLERKLGNHRPRGA
jgi:maleate cis-trans isomerase